VAPVRTTWPIVPLPHAQRRRAIFVESIGLLATALLAIIVAASGITGAETPLILSLLIIGAVLLLMILTAFTGAGWIAAGYPAAGAAMITMRVLAAIVLFELGLHSDSTRQFFVMLAFMLAWSLLSMAALFAFAQTEATGLAES
jgi:hypothetical protein